MPVADFVRAGRIRAAIRRVYAELFGRVDAILLLIPFAFPASLIGLPVIVLRCGLTTSGMPVGCPVDGAGQH